jgi:glucose-6-phosphate dehydrogenase assembly protein OpcA
VSTPDPVQQIFFEGQAVAVDTQAIESALRRLWAEGRQEDRGVVRACMANLVVYAGTPAAADEAALAIAEITATHLVRAIVLVSDVTAAAPALRAWLSAHCQLPKASGLRVCCEQVRLEAAGEAVDHLPSAVLPLLVPDLPVIVWWMGDPPFGASLFEQLIETADRLLVDTHSFEEPTFSLARLAALVRQRSGHLAVSDLNWARLAPWQDQLAQAFDSAETLPYLDRADRMTVHYLRRSGEHGVPEEALLLAGWFLNRLGWKQPPALTRIAHGHFRGRLRRAGREFALEIAPREIEVPAEQASRAGLLLTVEVRATLAEREATFQIERIDWEHDTITTTIALPDMTPLTSARRRPQRTLASLLAADLSRLDHDYLFEAALETAAHLSGALELLPR